MEAEGHPGKATLIFIAELVLGAIGVPVEVLLIAAVPVVVWAFPQVRPQAIGHKTRSAILVLIFIVAVIGGGQLWRRTHPDPVLAKLAKIEDLVAPKPSPSAPAPTTPAPVPSSAPAESAPVPSKSAAASRSEEKPIEPSAPQLNSRLRVSRVLIVDRTANPFDFPAVSIYWDNVGKAAAHSVNNHFAVAFTSREIPEAKIQEIQEDVLRWEGWEAAMALNRYKQLYPGDPADFTTIPQQNDTLAEDFRKTMPDVTVGKAYLYVIFALKYRDDTMPPGTTGVTEDCFYFYDGSFGRHLCGRRRSFLDTGTHPHSK